MENVILNSAQTQIKIVDFGLSNVWSSDSPLRTHCGSPEYAAPELFVAGRKYGPEVDLWSLGIILYGMIVGQLPFVSNRNEHVSSKERRKRFVAQINKGLAAPQRQAIAYLPMEFRSMMNKLLAADSSKRITIKELIVHPWITENGRKIIRTNPFKKLDTQDQLKIINEICELVQLNINDVINKIIEKPYGKLGGIYKILSLQYSNNLIVGDGILKTININNNNNKELNQNENVVPISKKSFSATKPRTKSIFTNTTSQTVYNSQEYQNLDYRTIKSSTMRRQVYSANLFQQQNRNNINNKTNNNNNYATTINNDNNTDTDGNHQLKESMSDGRCICKQHPSMYQDIVKPVLRRATPLWMKSFINEKQRMESETMANAKRSTNIPIRTAVQRGLRNDR